MPGFLRIGGVVKNFTDIEYINNELWAFFDSNVDLRRNILDPTECVGIDSKAICSPFPTFERSTLTINHIGSYWPSNTVFKIFN